MEWVIRLPVSHLFVLRTAFLQEANLLFSWDHPRQHYNTLLVNSSHHKSNQPLTSSAGEGGGLYALTHALWLSQLAPVGSLHHCSQSVWCPQIFEPTATQPWSLPHFFLPAMLPSRLRPFYIFHPPKRYSFIECFVLLGSPQERCLHNQKLVLRTVVPGRKNVMTKSTLPRGIYKKKTPTEKHPQLDLDFSTWHRKGGDFPC